MPERTEIQAVRAELKPLELRCHEAIVRRKHETAGDIEAQLRGAPGFVRAKVVEQVPLYALHEGDYCLLLKVGSSWFCIGTYSYGARSLEASGVELISPIEVLRKDGVSNTDWTELTLSELPDSARGAVLGLTIKPNDSAGGALIVRRRGDAGDDDYQPWVGASSVGLYMTTQVMVAVDEQKRIEYKITGVTAPDTCNVRIRLQGFVRP